MTGDERQTLGRLEGKVDGLGDEIDDFKADTKRRFETVHKRIDTIASKRNQAIIIVSYVIVAGIAVVNLWITLKNGGG